MTARVSFVAAVVAVVASLTLSAWRMASVVSERELDAMAAAVRTAFRAGDLIVVEPDSIVGARQRLGDLPLIAPRRLEPDMLAGFRRVHLIELDVIGAGGEARQVLSDLGSQQAEQRWEDVTWTPFVLHRPVRKVLDLGRDIAQARVRAIYPDGVDSPCRRFERDRWICPRDSDWNYVGRMRFDIGGERRDCVWMHPVRGGGRLLIDLPPLDPPQGVRTLIGGFGFTRHGGRAARTPVHVTISGAGGVVLERDYPPSTTWRPYRVELGAEAGPLRIELRTDNNGAAHFCGALSVIEVAS